VTDSEIQEAFLEFCKTVAALRDPKTGCPWDIEQTHETLRSYMIEEAYEAAEVMKQNDPAKIADELGDVLLQVVLNAQLGADAKTFNIVDVINCINSKMIRRHPHVFGSEAEKSKRGDRQGIKDKWQEIKRQEAGTEEKRASGYFDKAKDRFPASTQALKIGKIAAKINFDWDHPKEVLNQFLSEVEELKAEFDGGDPKRVAEEMSDVYFSMAQLCRHLNLDPELVAADGNQKFFRRFALVEEIAQEQGIEITAAPREVLEELWLKAKEREVPNL
jgi:MazG family protein